MSPRILIASRMAIPCPHFASRGFLLGPSLAPDFLPLFSPPSFPSLEPLVLSMGVYGKDCEPLA
jgi:hypothetical protein